LSARVLAAECEPLIADVVVYYDPYHVTEGYGDSCQVPSPRY
jgi:hypothetical protein